MKNNLICSYMNPVTNTVLDVYQTGASFKTITSYPAVERPANRGTRPAEQVTKTHRTWNGVEKRVEMLNLLKIESWKVLPDV